MIENPNVDWISAIAMLVAGLIVGAMFMYRVSRSSATKKVADAGDPDRDIELRDLEAKREELITQIREIDDTSTKVAPEQIARERYELELRTAETLRDIDAMLKVAAPKGVAARTAATAATAASAEASEEETPRRGFLANNPAAAGFVYGALSIGAIALLFVWATRSANERAAGAPPTGGMGMGAPQQGGAQMSDPEIEQLTAAVNQSPDNVDARLNLAQAWLMRENFMEVFNQTKYVLERDPQNVRALSYQALVRLAMGDADSAEAMLKNVIKTNPDYLDGWVHLSLVYAQTGRKDDAKKAIEEAIKRHPDKKDSLERLLSQIMSAPEQQASNAPAAAPAQQGEGGSVTGTIDVDGALKGKIPPAAVLYVMARPSGLTSGAPVAVKRMPASSFPMAFSLSAADSMMGQPLPQPMSVEAKIDFDGDAATRDPNEPHAEADPVSPGTTSLMLVLKH